MDQGRWLGFGLQGQEARSLYLEPQDTQCTVESSRLRVAPQWPRLRCVGGRQGFGESTVFLPTMNVQGPLQVLHFEGLHP